MINGDNIVTSDLEIMNQEDDIVNSDIETLTREDDIVISGLETMNQEDDIVTSGIETLNREDDPITSDFETPNQENDIVTSHSLKSIRKATASRKQKQTKVSLSGRTKEGLDNDRFEKRTRCETGKKKECLTSVRSEKRLVIRKKTRRYNTNAHHQRSMRKRVFNVLKQRQEEQESGNSTKLTLKANILDFKPLSCPSKEDSSGKSRNERKISSTIDRKTGNNFNISRYESVCECHVQDGLLRED